MQLQYFLMLILLQRCIQHFNTYSARMLTSLGYLKETAVQGGFGSTFDLSTNGARFLRKAKLSDDEKLMLMPNAELLHEEKTSGGGGVKISIAGAQPTGPKYVFISYLPPNQRNCEKD